MYKTMLLKDLDIKTGFCQQAQEKAKAVNNYNLLFLTNMFMKNGYLLHRHKHY